MFAGLGAVISEFVYIIESDHIAVLFGSVLFLGAFFDFRIEVIAVFVFNFKQPAHVIDAGYKLFAPLKFVFHVERF